MPKANGLLLILCGALAIHLALKATGFCYARGGWLSDKQIIAIAVEYDLSRVDPARAEMLRSALDQNPECCRVHRGFYPYDSGVERMLRFLTGSFVATVRLNYNGEEALSAYDARFLGDPSLITVSACGRANDAD